MSKKDVKSSAKAPNPPVKGNAAGGEETQGPRHAAVVQNILKSMGVDDYEPHVVLQLIEFMQRYVSDVLEDAGMYSEHASKSRVDVDDVRLAIQARVNFSFTGPPPREFVMELATKRNAVPLPPIPERMGVRMPPERYCLSSVNYQVDVVPESQDIANEPAPAMRAPARAAARAGSVTMGVHIDPSAVDKVGALNACFAWPVGVVS